MADFNARVVLSAKNNAGAPLRQLRNDLRSLTESFRGLGRTTNLRDIGRNFVNLGRTIGDIHRRHIRPMLASLAQIGGFTFGAALAASTAGFVASMNRAADAIDKVSKASRRIGMDPNQLRAFSHVADLAGVSFESVQTGMQGAAKAFLELQKGVGKADSKLKEFAPQLRFQMKTAKDTAEAASMALSAMHDAIERGDEPLAQLIAETVFKSSDWMAIGEMTGEEVRKGIESALKLLGSLKPEAYLNVEAFNDSLTDMLASFKGTRDQIAAEILPELTPIIKQWTETFTSGRGEFVKSVVEPIKEAITWLKQVDWAGVGAAFREIGAGVSSALRDIKNNLESIVQLLRILNDPGRWGNEQGQKARQFLIGPENKQSGETRDQSMDSWLDGPPALPRRAKGGPLGAGQLAIVGEEGPELFAPNAAGRVFTASQTRAMMRQQMGDGSVSGLARAIAPLTDAIEDLTDAIKPMKLASLGGGPGGVGGLGGVREAIRNGTIKVPGPGGVSGAGTSFKGGDLKGASGEILKTLRASGFSDTQAFALLGHMQQESGLSPTAWNSREGAGGLLQWRGNRLENLKRFAASRGTDWQDRATQAAFVKHEMDNDPYENRRSARFRSATTLEDASAALRDYVRFGDNSAGARLANARRFAGEAGAAASAVGARGPGLAALVPSYGGKDVTDFLKSKAPGKDLSHLTGLDADFASRMAAMLKDAPQGVSIFSGYRSPERQQELWQNAVRKYGSEAAARKWVAPPGKSMHNQGTAADLGFNGGAFGSMPEDARRWLHENAPRYGLKFPLGHEPWHIEKQETRGGSPFTDPRRNFARNLRPNMNRKSFEPAMRDRGPYAAAEVPASKVEIGKGEISVKLQLPQGMSAGGVSVRQPENIVANVGVDRTGTFKPAAGTKTGTRSDLRQPRV